MISLTRAEFYLVRWLLDHATPADLDTFSPALKAWVQALQAQAGIYPVTLLVVPPYPYASSNTEKGHLV